MSTPNGRKSQDQRPQKLFSISLPLEMHKKIKRIAFEDEITMREWIVGALEKALKGSEGTKYEDES